MSNVETRPLYFVEQKFENLLGIGIKNRFKFYDKKFHEAVEYLNNEIFNESFKKKKQGKVYVN